MEEETPNIEGLSFEEKVSFLEEELPKPIRDFLHSPKRDAISLQLSQKYNLHADQASAFEQAYLYMLLGVNTPRDFVDDLKKSGIPESSVQGLTKDINEEVFKKLLTQQLEDIRPIRTEHVPAEPIVPVMQVVPIKVPSNAPSQSVVAPLVIYPEKHHVPEKSPIRTMQTDIEEIQSGLHPQAPQAPQAMEARYAIPDPSHITPARSFQTASIPYTPAPTTSISRPENMVVPVVAAIPHQEPAVEIEHTPIISAGSDPYREQF